MGVRTATTQTNTIIASPALAAETIIATIQPISLTVDSAIVTLFWMCNITIGTTGTAMIFRIRRGTALAATLISAVNWSTTVVAGNSYNPSGHYFEAPGALANVQYSLTAQITAATAPSTVGDVCLSAMVL